MTFYRVDPTAADGAGDWVIHRQQDFGPAPVVRGAMTGGTKGRSERWFWRPPRAHGDIIADRTVSFLELF